MADQVGVCRVISLFSGIGGLDLGFRLAVPSARVIAYVERDTYCQRVLRARIAEGLLDDAPIFPDVREFTGTGGGADAVIGGFPCQPWSQAGKRRGIKDERWLWPDFARIVRNVGPQIVFLENVPGLLNTGLGHVLGDMAGCGFDAEWDVFSAGQVGAPHVRNRVFVLAHAHGQRRNGGSRILDGQPDQDRADTPWHFTTTRGASGRVRVVPPPGVKRMADGAPDEVDRHRVLGNTVVPIQAAMAFRELWRRLTERNHP